MKFQYEILVGGNVVARGFTAGKTAAGVASDALLNAPREAQANVFKDGAFVGRYEFPDRRAGKRAKLV